MIRVLTSLVLVLFSVFSAQLFSSSTSLMSEETKEMVWSFFSLDWKESGTHMLPRSNSKLILPKGYRLLLGEEAKKGRILTCGGATSVLEAVVYDESFENVVLFEYLNGEFMLFEAMKRADPKKIFESFVKNTEKGNREFKINEGAHAHVIEWAQIPSFDIKNNIVYWAIETTSEDEGSIINSVALIRSQGGLKKISWLAPKSSYVPFGGHLDIMLQSLGFKTTIKE